jgi:hypothetical protein
MDFINPPPPFDVPAAEGLLGPLRAFARSGAGSGLFKETLKEVIGSFALA